MTLNRFDHTQAMLKGLRFIDLFAGIGGFHLALKSFGAECVFASEWDKYAQQTYYANFGMMPAGDITTIHEKEIPAHDLLCAGFPCQAFSISGKQRGFADSRGSLFFDIVRIATYHQPKILLLENVKHFARHNHGRTLQTVKMVLDQIGYHLWHQVLNASFFGLPQHRERIYMIAIRKDLEVNTFSFPQPTFEPICLKDMIMSDEETKDYIIDRTDIVIEQSKIPRITSPINLPLKPIRIGTINKGGQGERIYSELGHAITLSAYGGGPGSKTGCYLINGKVRKLAPRECARIQGFPDTFQIPVSDPQAWKQFGNSVPIPVVQHILKALIDTPGLFFSSQPESKEKQLVATAQCYS